MQQQQYLPIGGANSNTPPNGVFERLLADAQLTFQRPNALQLYSIAFAIGEKLARFRLAQFPVDAVTLAELKALYGILVHQRHLVFFYNHAELTYEALLDLTSGTVGDDTPADVAVMAEIYNAVWKIHYRQFEQDPASALAEWNVHDLFQTRAVRAVLFDIDFKVLLLLAMAIIDSCLDMKMNHSYAEILDIMNKKRGLVLNIVMHRKEADNMSLQGLLQSSLQEQEKTLRRTHEYFVKK